MEISRHDKAQSLPNVLPSSTNGNMKSRGGCFGILGQEARQCGTKITICHGGVGEGEGTLMMCFGCPMANGL